eukprot:COSAG02_NODE_1735_length_11160_cov_4.125305_9_plen_32_part_00
MRRACAAIAHRKEPLGTTARRRATARAGILN